MMLHFKIFSAILLLLSLTNSMATQTTFSNPEPDAILGKWTNPDQTTHFQIYKQNNKYYGKVLWGTGRNPKDINNPDPTLRNRELIGLVMLHDFNYKGKSVYSDGTIYDPNDGKTYSCKLSLQSKDQLEVRGYVGIPLFGRSETWTRIKS
jgi:uncharacterized protein (DUF2147 family)